MFFCNFIFIDKSGYLLPFISRKSSSKIFFHVLPFYLSIASSSFVLCEWNKFILNILFPVKLCSFKASAYIIDIFSQTLDQYLRRVQEKLSIENMSENTNSFVSFWRRTLWTRRKLRFGRLHQVNRLRERRPFQNSKTSQNFGKG